MLANEQVQRQFLADTVLIDLCELRRLVYRSGSESQKRMFHLILKMMAYIQKNYDMKVLEKHSDEELKDRIEILSEAIQRNAQNSENLKMLRDTLNSIQNELTSRERHRTT